MMAATGLPAASDGLAPGARSVPLQIRAEMERAQRIRSQLGCGWTQALLLAANQASFGERSDAACGMRAVAVAGGMPAGQQGAGVSAGQGNA